MNLDALEIFCEVAHQGGFSNVARLRDRDPSWVSRAVSALEDELGLRLFQRTTRRVALTEAGQIFLDRIEPLLAEMEEAKAEALAVASTPMGNLRLTCSVSFGQQCLVPLLGEFRAAYPQISLDLVVTDANLDLVRERIDLAVRLGPRPAGEYISTKVMDTLYRVCASPGYLSSHSAINSPGDLGAHYCLTMPLPGFRSRWQFRDKASGPGTEPLEIPIKGDIVISNAIGMRDAVIAGLGPALVAHWLVDEALASGLLVDLFPHHEANPTVANPGIWLIYPSRSYLAQKVRVAVDFFKVKLKKRMERGAAQEAPPARSIF